MFVFVSNSLVSIQWKKLAQNRHEKFRTFPIECESETAKPHVI